jgi:hypothetical protein
VFPKPEMDTDLLPALNFTQKKTQKSKIKNSSDAIEERERERERERELRQDSICFSATLEAKEKTAYTRR